MSENETSKPLLTNRLYDILKFTAQILLPGAGTLYFSLAGLWNLPNATEVVGTVVAVDTFLGLLLGLSTANYNNSDAKYDGVIRVEEGTAGPRLGMQLTHLEDPLEVANQNEVVFKVVKEPAAE